MVVAYVTRSTSSLPIARANYASEQNMCVVRVVCGKQHAAIGTRATWHVGSHPPITWIRLE